MNLFKPIFDSAKSLIPKRQPTETRSDEGVLSIANDIPSRKISISEEDKKEKECTKSLETPVPVSFEGKSTVDSSSLVGELKKDKSTDSIESSSTNSKNSEKKFFFVKPTENIKLTIILIENTNNVFQVNDILIKIVKSLVAYGYVCIINCGSIVTSTDYLEISEIDFSQLLSKDDLGEKSCLYDSLVLLEDIVSNCNQKIIKETATKKVRIEEIEVIGIGKCIDNGSIVPREMAIDSFSKVAFNRKITTKYFCLTESNFVDAASIGFHSIGAIFRNYV